MVDYMNFSPKISTHALTEGDHALEDFFRDCEISTHALTEGDLSSIPFLNISVHFNSRPHGGRRQI